MEIRKYVVVDSGDQSEDWEFDTADEAIATARTRDEPLAVIARVYVYDDSELVWTSTGEDFWPPDAVKGVT